MDRRQNEDDAYDAVRQRQVDEQIVPRVRFSHLRAFGRSGAHGQYALETESKVTRPMERGTALHALVFDTKKVVAYPGAVRRGKEYEAFKAQHSDTEILTQEEYSKTISMAEAVRSCKLAQPYLEGITEEKLLFNWMGLNCRATPDVRGNGFLTELKSSMTSDPAKFLWHARRMAYHAQLRFQEYACTANCLAIKHHYIVCVESSAPFPVTVFHVETEALEEGEKLLTLWGERLKNCVSSRAFPPYTDCIVPLVWPKDDVIEFGDEE